MKVIVKYLPQWTIGKVQGHWHVCTQNVVGIARLKLSMPQCSQMIWWARHSSSSSCCIPGLSERGDPYNNWFPVRNRVSLGYIEAVSRGALGCNHRQSIRKLGFDGKYTFFTTPTHDSDWLYFQENFRISSLEWKHRHPATTSTAWLPGIAAPYVPMIRNLCSFKL